MKNISFSSNCEDCTHKDVCIYKNDYTTVTTETEKIAEMMPETLIRNEIIFVNIGCGKYLPYKTTIR